MQKYVVSLLHQITIKHTTMKTLTNNFDTARTEIISTVNTIKAERKNNGESFYTSEIYHIISEVCKKYNVSDNSMVYSLGLA